ncbi:hypothetical protein VCHC46B1_0923 [Vibrio cholerae HC-46B1]|nr:hypothetical protein VCHE45_1009 [Vibrio cholerae HE-45]EKG57685.1 hypothetical protein VCHC52A1_0969 [Vibrio cholerae HC-52A1]EKK99389.1 hypothetical protein VCCP1035_1041 [Vibrio cholerae CP1035(8)]EKL15959.1 hypothetical protein VCHC59A1_1013 [Vibrio cholerae HC-59A1]EKL98178.1 hypothetical protein VCHC46B1_0923 [Vibrio cholerae HC-46B1]EKM08501.1 hypothetical protein VCHC59B1_0801 [Vibrio cholerae HC-59B1]
MRHVFGQHNLSLFGFAAILLRNTREQKGQSFVRDRLHLV